MAEYLLGDSMLSRDGSSVEFIIMLYNYRVYLFIGGSWANAKAKDRLAFTFHEFITTGVLDLHFFSRGWPALR